jgi:hypothetical protein
MKACVGLAQYDESEGKHSYHVKETRAKVHGTDTCDYCVYDLGLCQASA